MFNRACIRTNSCSKINHLRLNQIQFVVINCRNLNNCYNIKVTDCSIRVYRDYYVSCANNYICNIIAMKTRTTNNFKISRIEMQKSVCTLFSCLASTVSILLYFRVTLGRTRHQNFQLQLWEQLIVVLACTFLQ